MLCLRRKLLRCLVPAEFHANGELSKSCLQTISAAAKTSYKSCTLLLLPGAKIPKVPACVSEVIKLNQSTGSVASLLAHVVKEKNFTHLFASNSSKFKDALPRVGGILQSQPLSDVSAIISDDVFTRPIYAGNAIETIRVKDVLKICTIRVTSFEPALVSPSHSPIITEMEISATDRSAVVESEETRRSEKPQLQSAARIVTGGRGLKSKEKFHALLEPLCDKLGAALGATRAVVDAGFCDNELQVGQTGKVVAPELYIAVGVSGAIQHIAGMKESKVIVAINSDQDAPIFSVADYGLVGDCAELVPELVKKL